MTSAVASALPGAAPVAYPRRQRPVVGGPALAGLAGALAVRVGVSGAAGAASQPAGLVFAALLVAVAAATSARGLRRELALSARAVVGGFVGAAVLCAGPVVAHGSQTFHAAAGFGPWAGAVVCVATAEEALLRGSLFSLLLARFGSAAAVGVTSVAFALLHVPLYGWHVLPLDVAVGVWLGALRLWSGSAAAPAIAHAGADLVGWWLL